MTNRDKYPGDVASIMPKVYRPHDNARGVSFVTL